MCDCAKKQLIYRRGDRWVTTGGHGVNFSVQADGKASDMRYVIIIILIFFSSQNFRVQIQTDKEHTGTAESTIRTEPHPQRQQKNLSRRNIHI